MVLGRRVLALPLLDLDLAPRLLAAVLLGVRLPEPPGEESRLGAGEGRAQVVHARGLGLVSGQAPARLDVVLDRAELDLLLDARGVLALVPAGLHLELLRQRARDRDRALLDADRGRLTVQAQVARAILPPAQALDRSVRPGEVLAAVEQDALGGGDPLEGSRLQGQQPEPRAEGLERGLQTGLAVPVQDLGGDVADPLRIESGEADRLGEVL